MAATVVRIFRQTWDIFELYSAALEIYKYRVDGLPGVPNGWPGRARLLPRAAIGLESLAQSYLWSFPRQPVPQDESAFVTQESMPSLPDIPGKPHAS